ncbi:Sak single strand annealing protein [Variovorax sp. PAMC 28711]|uniref:Sak single strand annealing protein n=1 Tax=Variovorax sp. PAMC 28711 TaxID=1795631 RepID=UPI00078ECA14|nr:DUF1071 domain-containing protein [Variovorax sp. PAMC 28711]AMM23200.1 hypothetical protein AX767_01520 [Variovorax sp. PAMC 28711]
MKTYNEVAAINVGEKTERKGNLTYLSWAWAVDQLLRLDATATWEYKDPVYFKETLMVFCSVTAFGKTMTAQLPVMDHKNKAIPQPDAFQVNTAMQRCLAKAIALHGLGLYIYAGEDLPPDEDDVPQTSHDRERIIRAAADMAIIKFQEGNEIAAYEEVSGITDNEEKLYLWNYLKPHSALRSAIKRLATADSKVPA